MNDLEREELARTLRQMWNDVRLVAALAVNRRGMTRTSCLLMFGRPWNPRTPPRPLWRVVLPYRCWRLGA